MGRHACAVAVWAGMAFCGTGVSADDGLELTQRLGSQHFDESELGNGFHLVDYGSGAVADDLRPYGVAGVVYLQFSDNSGSDAGRPTGGYYVFSSAEAARDFPAILLAELRQTGQPGWTSEKAMTIEDQRRGDITGTCIGSDGLGGVVCLYAEPGGLPVVIQITTGPLPGLAADVGNDERDNQIAIQAAVASTELMAALRRHLETAAGSEATAGPTQVEGDPSAIADRLLNSPVDTSMVGGGYQFDSTFSFTGDAVPQGWDVQTIVGLIFKGPESGEVLAGYMVFPSGEAARTFYDGYPDVLKADYASQGWAEIINLSHDSDDSMRTFQMPCIAGEAAGRANCLEYVTGTPIVINVSLPTPATDGIGADDRASTIAAEATAVLSALLPATRARLAEAMLPAQ